MNYIQTKKKIKYQLRAANSSTAIEPQTEAGPGQAHVHVELEVQVEDQLHNI